MNYFSVAFILAVFATGCNPDSDLDSEPEPPCLTLSKSSIEFDYSGGEFSIDITHNNDWKATLSAEADEWLSYETESASGDVTVLVITVLGNPLNDQRKATITFRSEDLIRVLNISQNPISGEVSKTSMLFGFLESSRTFTVTTTSPDWNISVSSDDRNGGSADWCSAQKEGTDAVSVTVETNTFDKKRNAKIVVTAGTLSWDVAVTQEKYLFDVSTDLIYSPKEGGAYSFTVNTTAAWKFTPTQGADWMIVEKTGPNKITVTAMENNGDRRTGVVSVDIEGFSHDVSITQLSEDSWSDKEIFQMHEATVGDGVSLVLMGDGYTITEMEAGGKYERDMRTAMDAFFAVYPYTEYKDYFNVWMVGAVSREAGLSTSVPRKSIDTVFDAVWDGPLAGSTTILCNQRTVENYAKLVSDRTGESMNEMTTVIAINDNAYAGSCMLGDGRGGSFSISLCPVGARFASLINHEVGGHGFGKLMDEYIYYPDKQLPSNLRSTIVSGKGFGWYFNVDLHGDILDTCWAGFAGNPKYSMVDTFEGSYMYGLGIWRPEFNSCMNNNIAYYNAPSRYAIVKRIHDWAGLPYTFEEFLVEDEIPPYPAQSHRPGEGVLAPTIPLAPPVIVDRWDYEL